VDATYRHNTNECLRGEHHC